MKNKSKISKNANWIITLVAVIAIFVVVSYTIELLPINLDLTTEGLYTLTDTSKEVLDGLEQKVTIYALFDRTSAESDTSSGGKAEIVRILDNYDVFSKVNVEYVDLDRNPSFLKETVGESSAANYDEGDYIVVSGDNVRKVDSDDIYVTETQTYNYLYSYTVTTGIQAEKEFTSAILKAVAGAPVIYYSTDFGETDIKNYSTIVDYMEDSGYDFMPITLKTAGLIPDDAAALVFFGPTEDLTDAVEDMVERWLKKGHKAYFFMDVKGLVDDHIIYNEFASFNKLFAEYGIKLEQTLVSDSSTKYDTDGDSIFQATTSAAGGLEKLSSTSLYVVNSRSFDLDNMSEDGITAEAMIKTTTKGVSTSINSANDSRNGTAVVAASGTNSLGQGTSKICVFGSSATFSDTVLKFFGESSPKSVINATMTWMDIKVGTNIGDSIDAKDYNDGVNSYVIASSTQTTILRTIMMIAVPIAIVLVGVIVFIRRRHL